jgi:hypothetical protein
VALVLALGYLVAALVQMQAPALTLILNLYTCYYRWKTYLVVALVLVLGCSVAAPVQLQRVAAAPAGVLGQELALVLVVAPQQGRSLAAARRETRAK